MNRLLLPVGVLRFSFFYWPVVPATGRPPTPEVGRVAPHRFGAEILDLAGSPWARGPGRHASGIGHADRPGLNRAQDTRVPGPPEGGQNGSTSALVGSGRVPQDIT